MATWVLTAHKEEDEGARSYLELVEKLYALAKGTGQAARIVFDPDLKRHVPSRTFEESSEARRLVDEFADASFWHELIYRMTERDLERQVGGEENLRMLAPEKRFDRETPIEERYLEEFSEHGLERLEVVEQFDLRGSRRRTSD